MFICIFTYSFSAWIIIFTRPRHSLYHRQYHPTFFSMMVSAVAPPQKDAVMVWGCRCIGFNVLSLCPRFVASRPYVQRLKTSSSICGEAMKYMFFNCFFPKKVSKHLTSCYNCMSLVLIGCMKLDLFASGAKSLLGLLYSLQRHDYLARIYVSLDCPISISHHSFSCV